MPAPTPDASAYVPDAAFDRFVDPLAVGRAWDTLDSGALIDSALALMEGERVLLRPHRSLSTKEIVTTAARRAVERRDEASLARLEKAAATHQRDDLTQAVAAARSVGAAGKAASVPVEIGTVSPEEYRVCKDVSHAALRARLTGNVRYIAPIVTAKGDVVVPGGWLARIATNTIRSDSASRKSCFKGGARRSRRGATARAGLAIRSL